MLKVNSIVIKIRNAVRSFLRSRFQSARVYPLSHKSGLPLSILHDIPYFRHLPFVLQVLEFVCRVMLQRRHKQLDCRMLMPDAQRNSQDQAQQDADASKGRHHNAQFRGSTSEAVCPDTKGCPFAQQWLSRFKALGAARSRHCVVGIFVVDH